MDAQEKLELIVDRLLVKTQDNHCKWVKNQDGKYGVKLAYGFLSLYNQGGTIVLDICRDDIVISSKKKDISDGNSNLVRLFKEVNEYYTNYVNEHLIKILTEIQKLGEPLPF